MPARAHVRRLLWLMAGIAGVLLLVQLARPRERERIAEQAALERWEDEGGPVHPDPVVGDARPSRHES